MIAIRQIASYIPPGIVDNSQRVEELGYTLDFLDHKIGTRQVSRMSAGMDTSDMCVMALKCLASKTPIDIGKIDCIIVCTQNPDGHGIPHTSAVLHGKIGAPTSCASFDISLGCSGYIYGLSVSKSFMEANGLKNGLLFTSDPYSKILDPDDASTALLFGDGATATLLGEIEEGGTGWVPETFRFYTEGKSGSALNNDSGQLVMNGRAVFVFSATTVPSEVNSLLAKASLTADDIDLFLFHQGSKYIVDRLVISLNLPADKVPLSLAGHGNAVSSAIPIVFAEQLDRPSCDRILLCGFGVGLSVASCILRRHPIR